MKITLIGYGKMGKNIEQIALKRNHFISHKISLMNSDDLKLIDNINTDIVIEFTSPKAAFNNIKTCLEKQIPVVSGTTGDWINKKHDLELLAKKNEVGFLWASNFSMGVNIFFELNKFLATLMLKQHYDIKIEERHHTEKLDSPSGTAKTIQEDIKNIIKKNDINIISHRIKNEIGTHKIIYNSEIDTLEIKHKSKSRYGFALGAVIAAEWLLNKKGSFTMREVLKSVF